MASIMTVRATDELKESLKHLAAERGFTRNGLILNILWEWVKKEQKENRDLKVDSYKLSEYSEAMK